MNSKRMASRTAVLAVAGLLGFLWTGAAAAQDEKDKYLYKAQGQRDPFRPLITPAGYLINLEPETDEALHLEGIMFDPKGDSIAVINGELLRVGESLAEAVVIDIGPEKVTVMRNNETLELELRREE